MQVARLESQLAQVHAVAVAAATTAGTASAAAAAVAAVTSQHADHLPVHAHEDEGSGNTGPSLEHSTRLAEQAIMVGGVGGVAAG